MYTNWLGFKDVYLALIYNNARISDVQNFYYLHSSLKGSAHKVIENDEIEKSMRKCI